MEAANAKRSWPSCRMLGNIPIKAVLADQAEGSKACPRCSSVRPWGTQVMQFTQQLATLLGAGQALDRALQISPQPIRPELSAGVADHRAIREPVRVARPGRRALEQQHQRLQLPTPTWVRRRSTCSLDIPQANGGRGPERASKKLETTTFHPTEP